MIYYQVLDINDEIVEVTLSYSDVFDYFYEYSAVGCAVDADPKKC